MSFFTAARMSMYRPHWMSTPPGSAFDQAHLHQHPGVQHHQLGNHQSTSANHQSWSSSRITGTPTPSTGYPSTLPPTPPKDMSSHESAIGQPASTSGANNMSPSPNSPPLLVNPKQEFPNHHHLSDEHMGSREVKTPPSTTTYYHPDMNSSPGASGGFNSFTPNSGVCNGQRQSMESPNGNDPYAASQSSNRSKSSKNRPNAGN